MSQRQLTEHEQALELLEGEVLKLEEMARICGVSVQWLHERVEQEVIHAVDKQGFYYLECSSVVRIQQVSHIEQTYDADPQLAALVADMTEEIRRLKRQIRSLG
jgi:chaperone modulatory protein CbpM